MAALSLHAAKFSRLTLLILIEFLMLNYALYGLFVLLQIGDLASIVIALKNVDSEANNINVVKNSLSRALHDQH